MRKELCTLFVFISLFSISADAYYHNPMMQFVMQWMYLNSATSTCKEIISTPGSREGINNTIQMLLTAVRKPKGMGGLTIAHFRQKIDALFDYCEKNPGDILATALLATNKDLLQGVKDYKNKHFTPSRGSTQKYGTKKNFGSRQSKQPDNYFSRNYK